MLRSANLFLFIIGIFLLFRPPSDPDFGWHYKYGEYLVQSGAVLRDNIFSYTFTDYHWANSYWLSQGIIYLLTAQFSYIFLSLIFSIVLSLCAVGLFNKTDIPKTGKFIFLFLFFTLTGSFLATVRPLFFSTVLMLVLCYVLLYRPQYIKFLPLLFLAWANLHADFILGIFVFGIYLLFLLFRRAQFLKTLLVFILSVLVLMINPFGISLFQTLFKETNQFQFFHIAEWLPFSDTFIFFASSFYSASPLMYVLLQNYSKDKFKMPIFTKHTLVTPHVWYVVAVWFFFLISFRSQYFLRVFFVLGSIGAAYVWGYIAEKLFDLSSPRLKKVFSLLLPVFLVLLFAVSAEFFMNNLRAASDEKEWTSRRKYPYEAISYIRANRPEGNMFNEYNWGGYLIWNLPEYKTFVDGRMPSWRENDYSVFEDYIKVSNNQDMEILSKLMDKYSIRWFLLYRDSNLAQELLERGTVQKVYEDEAAIVLVVK